MVKEFIVPRWAKMIPEETDKGICYIERRKKHAGAEHRNITLAKKKSRH